MTLTPEMMLAVRREVRNHLNIILNCTLGASTNEDQEIVEPVPGGPRMPKRPVVHPYGFVSRAPEGKIGVTGRVGEHPGAQVILGVRDSGRAAIALDEGEAALYNEFGQIIRLKKDLIELGDGAADPAVLGTELKELLVIIVDMLIGGLHTLTTSPGNPTAPNPAKALELTNAKLKYLTTAATNILSQETFLQRGGA